MDKSSTEENKTGVITNAWLLLLLVFITPANGWRKLKSSRLAPSEYASKMFYPLLGITSLTYFAELFYGEAVGLQSVLTSSIVCFASGFFSYFVIQMLCRVIFSGEIQEMLTGNFGKNVNMSIIAVLCLFVILYNLSPVLQSIIYLLLIYPVYMVSKAMPIILKPKLRTNLALALLIGLNIALPIIMMFLLNFVLGGHHSTTA